MPPIRGVNMELVGDDDLKMMLTTLPKRTRDKIFARAFRTHLRLVRDAARAKAPVLEDESTLGSTSQGRTPGLLRRNIRTPRKFRGAGRLGVGVFISDRESIGIPSSSPWFYPAHVHFGHSVADVGTGQRLGPRQLLDRTGLRARSDKPLVGQRGVRKARERLLASGEVKRSVEPRPFMRDAWLENKDAIERNVIADLREQIPLEARALMGKSGAA